MRVTLATTTLLAIGLLTLVTPLPGQDLTWRSDFRFYGDNTEFFNHFRQGETLLGAQFHSFLSFQTSEHTRIHAGVFGDQRSGDDEFLGTVKPLLSFRYEKGRSLGVLGSLMTDDRHGLLEPLQVTTLELTRPVEYGIQWLERHDFLDAEFFLNWQTINTSDQPEIFDYGLVLKARPAEHLSLELQAHGTHRGGQLDAGGDPKATNLAGGPGVRLHGPVPVVKEASLSVFRLWSSGTLALDTPGGRPENGSGTYVRASISPGFGEFFTILWWGRDFESTEGDNNYNSVGHDPLFYRSRRRYSEIGFLKRMTIDEIIGFRVELRFHRIDNDESKAISGMNWEYSYRVVVDAPFELPILK